MPLLSGLFSRKNKSSSRPKRDGPTDSLYSNTTASELESNLSSPTSSSYVSPGRPLPNVNKSPHPESVRGTPSKNVYAPSMPSTPSPSSGSKLRLAFGRKKSNIPGSDLSTNASPETSTKNLNTSSRPAASRTSADSDSADIRRLRPPPSRSAIFAAYGDPNSALSTRSLPNDPSLASVAAELSSTSSDQPPQKRPSIFPWAKQTSSSPTPSRFNDSTSTSQDLPSTPASSEPPHSFNLKSFRHIRAPSPTRSNASNVSLTPPVVPRPRGASVNSDASQRISVGAFREAQARRSLAGSPVPSFRSPSPVPALPRSTSPEQARPRSSRSIPSMPRAVQQKGRSSMALAFTSDDSDSSCSSSEESEDETLQQRSGTRPSVFDKPGRTEKAKAKSEMGHGHTPDTSAKLTDHPRPPRATKSHVGHSFSPSPSSRDASISRPVENRKIPDIPPRSQSSLSHYAGGIRQRASASTSALTPTAAAKRASILAGANSSIPNHSKLEDKAPSGQSQNFPQLAQTAAKPSVKGGTGSQAPGRKSQDSSDSEDNAPLASLVGARRPGSAMSSYSNLHSRSTGNVATRSITHLSPKPLIDINELTGPKRSYTTPVEKNAAGFTEGPTLLAQVKPTYLQSPLVESPTSPSASAWHSTAEEPLTRIAPPVKFISPPDTPAKEMEEYVSKSDLQTAQVKPEFNRVPPVPTPGTSPEPKRDPITDRLTKVVQKNMSQNGVAVGQQAAAAPKSGPSRGISPNSDDESDYAPAQRKVVPAPAPAPRPARVDKPSAKPPTTVSVKNDHSPPDEELAQLLGTAGIKFISRTGDTSEDSTVSESDSEDEEDAKSAETANKDRIAPIPIKQRSPPPSFSVTSRPPVQKRENANSSTSSPPASEKTATLDYTRPRSITLTNSSTAFPPRKPSVSNSISASASTNFPTSKPSPNTSHGVNSNPGKTERTTAPKLASSPRQRSSTMLTGVPLASQMPKISHVTEKPSNARRNSPASSTGDSSSGRAPLTPRDGSDIGGQDTKRKGHIKRRSVSFEDDLQDLRPPSRTQFKESTRSGSEAGDTSNDEDREQKRRERRRGEAKAAIELGNVINGRGPIVDDDDDMPINQTMNMNPRMSTLSLNPMMGMGPPMSMSMPMGFGGSPNPAGWGGNMGHNMLSPASFMVPPPADPNFMVAHQQAMMIAKQAYQMAVAQQAMAAAGDEWERGSAIGGYSGGSVYGGSSGPSLMAPQYGMMGMMQGGTWPSSASAYGGGRSMYGPTLSPQDGMLSSSRSEYGGGGGRGGGGNWSSSRSSYGESFGPSSDQYGRRGAPTGRRSGSQPRDSGYFPPVPPIPASQSGNGRSSPDSRGNPRLRTASQPTSPGKGPRKAPPPSSWKAGM